MKDNFRPKAAGVNMRSNNNIGKRVLAALGLLLMVAFGPGSTLFAADISFSVNSGTVTWGVWALAWPGWVDHTGSATATYTVSGPVYKDSPTHFWYAGSADTTAVLSATENTDYDSEMTATAAIEYVTPAEMMVNTTSSTAPKVLYKHGGTPNPTWRSFRLGANARAVDMWLLTQVSAYAIDLGSALDNTPPTFTLTTSAVGGTTTNPNVTLTVGSIDDADSGIKDATISYFIDGVASGTFNPHSSTSFSATETLSNATHAIVVTISDNVGNSTTKTVTVTVNDQPTITLGTVTKTPASAVVNPSNGTSWYKSYSITATASDAGSGITTFQYTKDGSSWVNVTPTNATATINLTTSASYHYQFKALNGQGAVLSSPASTVLVNIDADAPTLTVGTPSFPPGSPAAGYYQSYTVIASALDGGSGLKRLEYTTDNGLTWTTGNTISLTADGTYQYMFHAVDNLGNATPVPDSSHLAVTVKIDHTSPVPTISRSTSPVGASLNPNATSTIWYSNAQTVTAAVSATDAPTGAASGYVSGNTLVSIDGGTYSHATSVMFANEGPHSYVFQVFDAVGNSASTNSESILIDRTPPTAQINSVGALGAQNWVNTSVVPFGTTTGDGNGSGVKAMSLAVTDSHGNVTTTPFVFGTTSFSLGANPAPGDYLVALTVTDNAGNSNTNPAVKVHYLPSLAWPNPSLTVDRGTGTSESSTGFTLRWNSITLPALDSATYSVSSPVPGVLFDNNNPASTLLTSTSVTVDASVASNQAIPITVKATDLAGNTATATVTVYNKLKLGTLSGLQYSTAPGPVFGNIASFQYSGGSADDTLTATPTQQPAVTKTVTLTSGANTLTGLTSHSGYTFELRGVNASGDVSTRIVESVFASPYPNNSPQAFAFEAATGSTRWIGPYAALAWTSSADPDHDNVIYTLHYGTQGPPTLTASTSATSWTPTGLVEGGTYSGFVTAQDFSADGSLAYGGTATTASTNFSYDSEGPVFDWATGTWPTGVFVNGKDDSGNVRSVAVTAQDARSGLAGITGTLTENFDSNHRAVTAPSTAVVQNADGSWSPWPAASGNYTVELTALDTVNNSSKINHTFDFDGTVPKADNLSFGVSPVKVADRTVYFASGTVSDDYSGVAKVEAQWFNATTTGAWQTFSGTGDSLDLTGLGLTVNVADGVYGLRLQITDKAGNVAVVPVSGSFIIDLSSLAATLSVTGGVAADQGTIVTDLANLTVDGQAADGVSSVSKTEYAVVPETANPTVWSTSWSAARSSANATAGTWYRVWFKATNGVGGTQTATSDRFLFDNLAPSALALTLNKTQTYAADSLRITAAATASFSGIERLELALGTAQDATAASSLMTGSVAGVLVSQGTDAPVWKVDVPAVAPGAYIATLTAFGANGLTATKSVNLILLAGVSPVTVEDNGPYATGLKARFHAQDKDHFEVQIVDAAQTAVVGWMDLPADQEAFDALTDLSAAQKALLAEGQTYKVQVRTVSAEGDLGAVYTSSGVLLDSTLPKVNQVKTVVHGIAGQENLFTDGQSLNLTWSVTPSTYSPLQSLALLVAKGAVVQKYYLPLTLLQTMDFTLTGLGNAFALVNGDRLGLTLEATSQSGAVADQDLAAVFVDTNAPAAAVVVRNGEFNNLTQPMKAQWVNSADAASGTPITYSWAFTKTPDDLASIPAWTADDGTHVASQMAPAGDGQIWYIVVRAVSDTGKTSYGVSQGITVDSTKPTIAGVYLVDTLRSGGAEPTYVNSLNGLAVAVDAFSQVSGISSYSAQYGVSDSGEFTATGSVFSSPTSPVPVSAYPLASIFPDAKLAPGYPNSTAPSPLVFAGWATNQAESTSLTPGYSAGVILDSSRPAIASVRVAVSNGQLFVDWDPDTTHTAVPVVNYTVNVLQGSAPKTSVTTRNRSTVFDLSSPAPWAEGTYTVVVTATNAAGTTSDDHDATATGHFWVDYTAPLITDADVPRFVSTSMGLAATANTPVSGIVTWRYQIGTPALPGVLTGGWVTLHTSAQALTLADTSIAFNQTAVHVADGDTLVAQVQVQSGAGLWSAVSTTPTALVDLTAPVVTGVSAPAYTTLADSVIPVSFVVTDAQSGVSAYRFGLRDAQGNLVEGLWTTVANLAGNPSETVNATLVYPPIGVPALKHGQSYRLVVQALNRASEQWTADVPAANLTVVDLTPAAVSFDNPRQDGRVEELTIAGQSVSEFVVNALPLNLTLHAAEDVSASLALAIQVIDPQGHVTQTNQTLTSFPATSTVAIAGANPGIYTVIVDAQDAAGNLSKSTQRIRLNQAPVAVLFPVTTTAGKPNALALSLAADPDASVYGDTVAAYAWNFGDASATSSLVAPTHAYHQNSTNAQPGTYVLSVTLTDNWGSQTQTRAVVTVVNTLSGTLYESETWHGSQVVTGVVTVPTGATLTLAPDARVQFAGNPVDHYGQGLVIDGALVAQDGATLAKVSGQSEHWSGILVRLGTATLGAADIRDADRGVAVDTTGSATLTGTKLHDNDIGLHVVGAAVVSVTGALVTNNQVDGIKEDGGGRPSVRTSTLSGNLENYYRWDGGSLSISEINELNGTAAGNVGE